MKASFQPTTIKKANNFALFIVTEFAPGVEAAANVGGTQHWTVPDLRHPLRTWVHRGVDDPALPSPELTAASCDSFPGDGKVAS